MFIIIPAKKSPTSPKKPPNAFMRYKSYVQNQITQKYGQIQSSEISKIAAEMWKSEPETVKNYFKDLTDLAYMEYKNNRVNKKRKSSSDVESIGRKSFDLESNKSASINSLDELDSFDFTSFSTGWSPTMNDEQFKEYIERTYCQ
ncbi:hypothetical protein HK103_001420 [Boothiomyces macroporosus]|uniref:HMG box domain-containing protein n=1 Tax=Boothiomyces macroporosus TaxID=261099 RepID=A0AAD5Y0W3_9FUNG|nr:hypothetical protein HK103_001420 [Boothiomyces macroporosus]